MLIIGIILVLIGWFASIPPLITIGIIAAIVGLVLLVLGASGRQVGGRTWY